MRVEFSPQVAAIIERKVASGGFVDADAVGREALRVLEEQERLAR